LPTSSISFDPPVIAHRGANTLAPENTLAAFVKAKESGAKWVEFDVMLAASGEAVVIHDETLERTTNGRGFVHDYPYSYLQTLDAGSWFHPSFKGERIPTFKEVIDVIREQGLRANVEIKALPGMEEEEVKKIVGDIEKYWTKDMAPPLISSFSMQTLKLVRQYSPDSLLAILIHEWFDGWDVLAEELQCVSYNLNHEILDAEKARVIKNTGKFLLTYTVNDVARALELFSWGVDAVFSDNVKEIIESLSDHFL
jgi:glycerophosphoryl diester phosphodiesterase